MAYKVAMSKEAKDMAVRTKQKSLQGEDVVEKRNECYFCGNEVDEVAAKRTKEALGRYICVGCLVKVLIVVSNARRDVIE